MVTLFLRQGETGKQVPLLREEASNRSKHQNFKSRGGSAQTESPRG